MHEEDPNAKDERHTSSLKHKFHLSQPSKTEDAGNVKVRRITKHPWTQTGEPEQGNRGWEPDKEPNGLTKGEQDAGLSTVL